MGGGLAGGDGVADFGPGHVLDQERLRLGEERGGENQCGEAEFHRSSIAYSDAHGTPFGSYALGSTLARFTA